VTADKGVVETRHGALNFVVMGGLAPARACSTVNSLFPTAS
jgi:hypothetical protein